MTERASFVTRHISCPECLAKAEAVLAIHAPDLQGTPVTAFGEFLAGGIEAVGSDPVQYFEREILPKLQNNLCHEFHLVLIPDADNVRPVVYDL